jgi:hypothetical protein
MFVSASVFPGKYAITLLSNLCPATAQSRDRWSRKREPNMPNDDPYDDEEWYSEDDEDDPDEAEVGRCPECHVPVYDITDRCPACGYWFSEADRRAMWSGASKPKWVLVTAGVILIVLILGMLTLRF